jgi:hypothetical protein
MIPWKDNRDKWWGLFLKNWVLPCFIQFFSTKPMFQKERE